MIKRLTGLAIVFVVASAAIYLFVAGDGMPGSKEHIIDDDDVYAEKQADLATVAAEAGKQGVHISTSVQAEAGIHTTVLGEVNYTGETHALALVMDLQSLLELRSKFREQQSASKLAKSAVQVSRQEYDRLQLLHKEAANISLRQLQQGKLQWQTDVEHYQSALDKSIGIRQQMIQAWGEQVTSTILQDGGLGQELMKRQAVLLLVTIEPGTERFKVGAKIKIRLRNQAGVITAYLLSPAPMVDTRIQGETYYYYARAAELRTGEYVDAWLPGTETETKGVIVPPEAVVWYADKPWVYVRQDEETFVRQKLEKYQVSPSGWFILDGLQPGNQIVTEGAQMLLSEEFHWSIPDEDDNP